MKTALLVSHSEKKQFSRSVVVTIALVISMIMNLSKVQGQNCTVNAGVDQTICVNSQLVLYGQTSGLFQGTGNITWSQFSGPSVTITNPHSLTTTVTGYVANQVYRFILSAKCLDGSLVTDLVKYTVTPITTASAGPDQTLCPGTGTLAANTPGAGETGTWTVLTGTGVAVTSIHSPTSTITVSSTGSATVTLRWTIQGPVGPPQCESYDDVIISNQGGVSPVTAGTNQTLSNCYSSTTSTGLNASFGGNGINGQQGTWSVVSGPNIPSFANIHQNNTTVSNLIQGTYVLRWTVAGPCVSGTATMTIIVPAPTANVTGATVTSQSFCDGRTSFILSGNFPLYSGETVLWTQTSGPAATIASPNSPITSVTVPAGSGTYTFLYTISNPVTLCSSSATSTISFSTPPSLTLTAGSFLTLACGDSTATISYTQSGSGTVQWSIISGPATPFYPTYPTSYQNSAASPEVIPHLSKAGTYLIRFRKSPGVGSSCSTVFADINVIVSMPPTASNAGTAQLLACNIFSTSLAGNVPFVGTGHWTQVSGPNTAVITNIYFNTSPVSGLINGVYVFRWLISGGPMCPSSQSDTRVIVASINPTTANAGPDQTVCYATPLILQGNSTILNEVGTWTVTPTGPVFSDVHNPHAVVTGLLASTVYTFTWTIVNACSSSSDAAVITTSGTQGPIQSNAGPDQCLASGTTTMTMAGNNPSPGTGTWVRLTGPNNPTITNASLYNTTVTGLINGTYTFQWSISYNSCSVSRDTMKVTISAPATIANAGGDKTVCGTSVTLTANTPVVGTGMWTQQVGNAGAVIVSPTSPTTNITGLIDGVYVFRWTITNDACTSNYSDATVYVSTPPSAAVAGPDQTLCGPTSTTMAATTPLNGTGNWMLVSGPNSPVIGNFFSSTTTVSGMITGPYLFRWTVTGGPYCPPNTSTMSITVMENANAGSSQSYCSVTAVNLAGNTASTGTWTQVGTTPNVATITTTGSNTATASGLITGVYTFQYTISAGNGCPGSSSTTTVTISGQPAQADAGPEQVHCGATQFFLSATPNPVPGGQTGTWSQIYGPGGGSFSDVHSPTATFNGATAGLYVFVWTISEGSCSNGSQIRITNNAPPTTANAGPDQDVCGSIATMAANAPTNGTGNWSQISGPNSATFSSLILPNTTVTGLIEGTYVFAWTISNGTCPASTDNVTITVHNNPTVANAGPDQSLCSLTSVTLAGNIIASGNGLWTQAGGPAATINNPTQNNTTVTLPLPGVSPNVYTFVWTSTLAWTLPAVGSCSTSDTVVITNNPVPTVSNAGPNQSICLYSAVVMAANTPVVGTGTWTQTGGPTTVSFSNINSPTTSVNGVDVGTYTCRWTISNTICPDSYSDVQVTMNPQPTIAIAGPNQSLCNTTVATMAGNTPDPGHGTGTWSQISGPATVTFTNPNSPTTAVTGITSAGSYVFQWEIATSAACTSNDQMTVLKNADISIVGPSDATICNGGTAALSVTVSGGVSPYTYQWQQSNDGISGWISVTGGSGATSSSYTTAVLASDLYYRCQVTCSCGNMTSGVAHVTVVPDPSITVNPVGSTICSNTTWAMSVTASGGTPSLNYQWQRSTTGCGGSWTNIGANSPNYTTAALTQTTYYRVIVSATGNGCNNATSTCATVYVPRITTSPSSGTICTGGNFTMNVVVDGGSATLAYQWQSSPDNLTWGNVTGGTGANTATYTTDVLTSTTYYKCIVTVTSPNCADLVSSTATVTIVGDPNITLQPAGNTICNGGTSTLSVTATGGTPTLLYQWQYSLSNSPYSWSNVSGGSGGTTNTYTTPALAVTTYYRVLITAAGSGCDPTATTPATVTVVPDPTIDIQPTDATICSGTTTTITVSASGGTPSLNYQWQYSLSNSPYSWNNVSGGSGGTTNAYTTPSLASTTYYRVQISATGNGCDPINSNPVAVHIPHITTQPVNATVCDGGTQVLTVAAGSDGGTATFAYQWQVSAVDCSIGFFDIPLATTPSYTTPVLTGNRFYKCVITVSTPSCSNLISNCASVTVVPDPYITGQPSGGSICSGSTFNMTVTASGGTPSLTYQWQSSGALAGPYSNVVGGSGANTSSYTTPALAATTYYQVIVSAAGNGCGTATSVPVTVSVSQNATANAGGNSTICSTGTYTIAGSSATNFTSLLWTTSGTGTFNNPTALHPIYSPSAADITAGTVSLTLTAYATSPCSNASNSMTLTINIAPVSNAGPAQTFCSNITSATMAANNPAPGTGLWSKVSGPGSPTITTPASPTTTITGLGIGASVFRWTVSNGVCAPAVSDVTITRQVCVPVAVDDYATTPEDTPVSGNVLTNDSDPNGLTLSVTQFVVNGTTYAAGTTATIPGVGTLVINSNGTWTFTPALNYNGPVPAATYTITNGSNTASANLYITITPVNDPPVAVVDYFTTPEDTPVSGSVTGNDYDVDGNLNPNGYSLVTGPAHGTVSFNSNGSFTYTPSLNYNGQDSFIYSVCDLGTPVYCDTAIVHITIPAVNDPPVANNDYATTPEDTPVTISILSNDIDVDGSLNPATIDLDPSTPGVQTTYTVPGQGTFVVNPVTGIVTFTPVLNFNGTVTPIPYQVCDNGTPLPSQCAQALIHVTVTPVNDPPVANVDYYTTPEDTPVSGNVTGNDSDIDGNLSPNGFALYTPPTHGTITFSNNGSFTYTPAPNYNGPDSFIYSACDLGMPILCDTAIVYINITPVNDPPVANDDYATTPEDTPVTINILSNDIDVDGSLNPATIDLDPSTPGIQTTYTVPGQGTFVVNPVTGIVTFTPVLNFNGTVTPIPYQVCDNGTPLPSQCAQAVIHVTVTPVNDPPIVTGKTVTTPEDTPIIICSTISDVDPGSTFTAVMCGNPSSGTVSAPVVTGNQVCVTYTPNPNYNGTDNFCIQVCDNGSPVLCDTAQYTVNVTPVNDPPVANDDYKTTNEDTPVIILILSNDSDIDGPLDPSSIDLDPYSPGIQTSFTVPGQGTFQIAGTGVILFTPDMNFNGTVFPVTYQVCDNGIPLPALCALANIRVTVLPVNDPPSVTGKTVSTPEDTPIVICSTISDVDAGSTFTASICGNASNGVLGPPIVTGNQVCVTYTPNPNYNGTDNFCIQVCDNGSPVLCDTALYTVTVSAVNDPPIANDDNATTNEDTPVTINILSNDSDIDGVLDPATIDLDPLTPGVQTTYTVPGQGTFVVNPITGIVTFTPVLNFNGTVTPIPYQVCDNGTPLPSQCAQAVIHVTVTPVNDPPIVTGKTVTTPEDTPIIICSTISDVDPGSTFTAVMCGNPSSGTVSAPVVTGNQVCVTYTPNPNFNGTDNFCIEVCDNGSPVLCDTAHYTVIVT
ncbi:MAG: tandem-95 repeat protein, partial [Bacteroidetes bacterium]|nr:tandem-95 repeat protein [Bacteroidota bacterium]